jgi:opacity protein-like surface antigen
MIVFCLLSISFAYKDSFYMGAYGEIYDGELSETEVENDGAAYGGRIGWNYNFKSPYYAKYRVEFTLDERTFSFNEGSDNGLLLGISYAVGYNLDLLLTQEIVPYISIGMAVGRFDHFENASEMSVGVGLSIAFRLFEVTAEARREFWQMRGVRIPIGAAFDNDGHIDAFSAGINVKF